MLILISGFGRLHPILLMPPYASLCNRKCTRTWNLKERPHCQRSRRVFQLLVMSWGAGNIGTWYINVYHPVCSRWILECSMAIDKGFSFAMFYSGAHFQLHFWVMTLRWWQFPVTHAWHTWMLGQQHAALGALWDLRWLEIPCRPLFQGASTSRRGPGDLPKTGGSEPEFPQIWWRMFDMENIQHGKPGGLDAGLFMLRLHDFVSLCRMNTGNTFSSEISSRRGYFHCYCCISCSISGCFCFLLVFGRMQWR